VYYIYKRAFDFLEMGYASALSTVLFLGVLLITVGVFRWSKRWVYYEGGAH
jgi:multiple sugar transport system permease protein